MMQVPRGLLAVGGLVMAAALIGFTNPKTVHAVTAALVQVTNTAQNPVVTQGVGPQAAQIVHLHCGPGIVKSMFSNAVACWLSSYSNSSAPTDPYIVPANQSLIVTSVDIEPIEAEYSLTCSAVHQDWIFPANGYTSGLGGQAWVVSNISVHYNYPSGIVIGPGWTVDGAQDSFSGAPSICTQGFDSYDLYGYLTPA